MKTKSQIAAISNLVKSLRTKLCQSRSYLQSVNLWHQLRRRKKKKACRKPQRLRLLPGLHRPREVLKPLLLMHSQQVRQTRMEMEGRKLPLKKLAVLLQAIKAWRRPRYEPVCAIKMLRSRAEAKQMSPASKSSLR